MSTTTPTPPPADERPTISPGRAAVRAQLRLHWGQVMSVLVSQLGDLQRADSALREAADAAVELWPREDSPAAPKAWLLRAARRKAIDQYRRELRHQQKHDQIVSLSVGSSRDSQSDTQVPDMRLQLMLSCSHPALEPRVRVALLLHCVCGLDAAQIARAMQLSEISLAQQLARAKKRLRGVSGAFLMPAGEHWPGRRDTLLEAVLGVYRSGHGAEPGTGRGENLCELALWMSQLALQSAGEDAEVQSLAALLQTTQACESGRLGEDGEVLALEDQDHSRWDVGAIARAHELLAQAAAAPGERGPQFLQASIAAEQVRALAAGKPVDWHAILAHYQSLYQHRPAAGVALRAAIALGKARGAREGLTALEQLAASKDFRVGEAFHSARAEMLNQLGQRTAARQALAQAMACPNVPVARRRAIERRLISLGGRVA